MLIHEKLIQQISKLPTFQDRIHQAALYYAEQGIAVIPLKKNQKAMVGTSTGLNYHSSSANVKTVDKWFNPDNGKFKGCNIGIVCGRENGVFAIDIDVHGSVNGFDTLTKLDQPKLDAPMQRTPSGGAHFLLQWQENAVSSSGKIGAGIDTRGGDGQPRSHIVAWPSEIDGAAYSWEIGGAVQPIPDWVVDKMGVSWKKGQALSVPDIGRGSEEVQEGDLERFHSLDTIRDMLDHVPPDDLSYDQWLQVGQAINSQHPGEAGLLVWDDWSAQGERYVVNECERRWPGFISTGPVRMGTLIHHAKERGYKMIVNPPPHTRGDFSELVDAMNAHSGMILVGGKVCIAHKDPNGGINLLSKTDYLTLFSNQVVAVPSMKKTAGPIMVNKADLWMADENRRTLYNGIGFFPDKELWYEDHVNLWRGWGVEPVRGDWSRIHDHISSIICDSEESHTAFVLDWLTDLIKDPMYPKGTALVFHGHEGTGKGTFCEVIGKMLGKHYKHVTHEEHLIGRFNSLMEDALLIYADEVVYGGSRKVAGIIKALVTEEDMVMERKGVGTYMYKNRARLIISSNEDWYIPAGAQSRRFFVLDVSNKKANNRKYFDALYAEIHSGGVEAMMWDLMNRDITSNLNTAPETKALQSQRQLYTVTGDSVMMWLAEIVNRGDLGVVGEGGESEGRGNENSDPPWPEMVDRMELYEHGYKAWCEKKSSRAFGKGPTHFYRKLKDQGFKNFRPRAGGDIRRTKFKVPPLELLREALGLNED